MRHSRWLATSLLLAGSVVSSGCYQSDEIPLAKVPPPPPGFGAPAVVKDQPAGTTPSNALELIK